MELSERQSSFYKTCHENPLEFLFKIFPLLNQLRNYKLLWIWKDFLAGIIVACFHIPQSMGTGMAANLGPVYGIYLTFFPGLIYALMATSRHNSMGAFAPVAALVGVGAARTRMISHEHGILSTTGETISFAQVAPKHLDLAATMTFFTGIFQILMAAFGLDFLSRYFSHNVLDPFNCACSLQIMLVQIPNMFGVALPAYFGLNKHIMMIKLLLENITNLKWGDTLFAMFTTSAIIGFREFLQPVVFKYLKLIIPIEFIIMIIATILSYFFQMDEKYGITILGQMPSGIPKPQPPSFSDLPYPILEAVLTSVASIAFAMQAAKVVARKGAYQVSTRQELLAIGSANLFGSFFQCFATSSAVGRNVILQQMGSRSQLSALFGCLLTGLLLAFASQTLYYLPFSVIATIITLTLAVSLKMFQDLPRLFRASKIDAFEWLLTFVGCCLLDVEWGLLLGLLVSWCAVVYRTHRARIVVLGKSQRYEGIYTPISRDKSANEIPKFKILQITNSSLHFSNAEEFLRKVIRHTTKPVAVKTEHEAQTPNPDHSLSMPTIRWRVKSIEDILHEIPHRKATQIIMPRKDKIKCVILDFANVDTIDSTGLRGIQQLGMDLKQQNVLLYVASARPRHIRRFERDGIMAYIPKDNFVGYIQDAVAKATEILITDSEQISKEGSEENKLPDETFWGETGAPVEGLEYGEAQSVAHDDEDENDSFQKNGSHTTGSVSTIDQ